MAAPPMVTAPLPLRRLWQLTKECQFMSSLLVVVYLVLYIHLLSILWIVAEILHFCVLKNTQIICIFMTTMRAQLCLSKSTIWSLLHVVKGCLADFFSSENGCGNSSILVMGSQQQLESGVVVCTTFLAIV